MPSKRFTNAAFDGSPVLPSRNSTSSYLKREQLTASLTYCANINNEATAPSHDGNRDNTIDSQLHVFTFSTNSSSRRCCDSGLHRKEFCPLEKKTEWWSQSQSQSVQTSPGRQTSPCPPARFCINSVLSSQYTYTCVVILLLLLSNTISALDGDTFAKFAHKKHKLFVQGATEWTEQSLVECRYRFEYEKWPCTEDDHYEIVSGTPNSTLLKTKEAAFVQALTAASIIQTSLKLCFDGTENVDCDCEDEVEDRFSTVETADETNTFVKCNEQYIAFAVRVFGKFRQNWVGEQHDDQSLMINHNTEAGKRVLVKGQEAKCSCHGMSGSCSMKTCWQQLPQMRQASAILKATYNDESNANAVKALSQPKHLETISTLVTVVGRKTPSRNSLVFFDDSPDFCEHMHGRNCSKVIPAHYEQEEANVPDWERTHRARIERSCENLCTDCNLQIWERQVTIVDRECECVFHWCCTVNCSSCEVQKTLHSCSHPNLRPSKLT